MVPSTDERVVPEERTVASEELRVAELLPELRTVEPELRVEELPEERTVEPELRVVEPEERVAEELPLLLRLSCCTEELRVEELLPEERTVEPELRVVEPEERVEELPELRVEELPELRVVELLPELRVVELLPELLPRRVCAAISGATSMARASIMEAANVINLLIALSF